MKLNWKTACTCIGCIIGAVCITVATGGAAAAPSIATVVTAIGAGGAGGFLVGNKIDTEEKKVKNTAKELEIKGQTIESIRKDNETKQTRINELEQKHQEIQDQKTQVKKDLENAKIKANDSSLSEEERKSWRLKVVELEDKLGQYDNEDKNILKQISKLQGEISNNNKTISSVGSGSYDKKQGIWEFLTLENILIAFAIYALWQIVREDRK